MNALQPTIPWISLVVSALAIAISLFKLRVELKDRRKKYSDDERRELREQREEERKRSRELEESIAILKTSTDAMEVERAIRQARDLAKTPEPVKYTPGPAIWGDELRVPEIDPFEERLHVETLYCRNPTTAIPIRVSWEKDSGFPDDLPKGWLPHLVKAVIQAMPAKCPAYPNPSRPHPHDPSELVQFVRGILALADEFPLRTYPYSHDVDAVVGFIMSRLKSHWSHLPGAIGTLLRPYPKQAPELENRFLAYARLDRARLLGDSKSFAVEAHAWAVLLGVSEHIGVWGVGFSESYRAEIARRYHTILHEGTLDLGTKRWARPKTTPRSFPRTYSYTLCEDHWTWSKGKNEEPRAIIHLEPLRDQEGDSISADHLMAAAVKAIGVVAAPISRDDGSDSLTGELVRRLARAFESYAVKSDCSYRDHATNEELEPDSRLSSQFERDFTDGVGLLIRKCGEFDQEGASILIEGAKILVPDIQTHLEERRLRRISQIQQIEEPEEDEDDFWEHRTMDDSHGN